MQYDVVVALGCSYIHGSHILYEDGSFAGKDFRMSKLVADHYKVPEVNLSWPGGSNGRIFREAYNWISTNSSYKNPLFLIGLTGLTRTPLYSVYRQEFFDLHIFDFPDKSKDSYQEVLRHRTDKLLGEGTDPNLLKNWIDVTTKYFFDIDIAEQNLQREVLFLDSFLKLRNINYILFNSINDSITPIKDKINYLSFDIQNYGQAYRNNDGLDQTVLHDCWYHYLRERQKEVTEDFNDTSLRSPKPEWGKWFCGGHPSPNANKDLADRIIKHLQVVI